MNKFLSSLLRFILPRRFYVSHWKESYLAWLEVEIDERESLPNFIFRIGHGPL